VPGLNRAMSEAYRSGWPGCSPGVDDDDGAGVPSVSVVGVGGFIRLDNGFSLRTAAPAIPLDSYRVNGELRWRGKCLLVGSDWGLLRIVLASSGLRGLRADSFCQEVVQRRMFWGSFFGDCEGAGWRSRRFGRVVAVRGIGWGLEIGVVVSARLTFFSGVRELGSCFARMPTISGRYYRSRRWGPWFFLGTA